MVDAECMGDFTLIANVIVLHRQSYIGRKHVNASLPKFRTNNKIKTSSEHISKACCLINKYYGAQLEKVFFIALKEYSLFKSIPDKLITTFIYIPSLQAYKGIDTMV